MSTYFLRGHDPPLQTWSAQDGIAARLQNGAKLGEIGSIGFFDVDFEPLPEVAGLGVDVMAAAGHGLAYIDNLTHNVHRDPMAEWAGFYEWPFNFREIRYFDIEGQVTGVKSIELDQMRHGILATT